MDTFNIQEFIMNLVYGAVEHQNGEDDGGIADAVDEASRNIAPDGIDHYETYEDAGVLTTDKGVVLTVGRNKFYITIQQKR